MLRATIPSAIATDGENTVIAVSFHCLLRTRADGIAAVTMNLIVP